MAYRTGKLMKGEQEFSILSLFLSSYLNGPLANFVFIFLNTIWWFLLGWLITKILKKN